MVAMYRPPSATAARNSGRPADSQRRGADEWGSEEHIEGTALGIVALGPSRRRAFP